MFYFLTGKIVPFLELVVAGSSIFTIMAITIERYRVVYKPLNWKGINPSQVLKIIIAVWICAFILNAPVLSIVRYKGSNLVDGTPINVCRFPIHEQWQRGYILFMSTVVYVLPCLILFVLYFRVCRTLVNSRDTSLHGVESTYRETRRLRGQVINIITTVVVVFFICHLPIRVVSLWVIFIDQTELQKLGLERYLNLLYSARILFYLNHALNPILYNFVSKKFRTAFWWFWKSKCSSTREQHKDSRLSHRGVRLQESARVNKQIVLFQPKTRNGNSVRNNKSTQSSTCYTGEKINDFSFIYRKVDHKDVPWKETVPGESNKKPLSNTKATLDEKNRVATIHLKAQSDGFCIIMKPGEIDNREDIDSIPMTNMSQ